MSRCIGGSSPMDLASVTVNPKAAFTPYATGSVTVAWQPCHKIGIQQERLHGSMLARSRRAIAVSPGSNLSLNVKLLHGTGCHEMFSMNTDLKNCRYMDYLQESRPTAAYHVQMLLQGSKSCCSISRISHAACRVPCKRTLRWLTPKMQK